MVIQRVWDFKSSTLLQSLSISSSSTSNGGNTNKSKNDILNLILTTKPMTVFTTSLDKKFLAVQNIKSNNDESFKVHLLTSDWLQSTTNILQGYDLSGFALSRWISWLLVTIKVWFKSLTSALNSIL